MTTQPTPPATMELDTKAGRITATARVSTMGAEHGCRWMLKLKDGGRTLVTGATLSKSGWGSADEAIRKAGKAGAIGDVFKGIIVGLTEDEYEEAERIESALLAPHAGEVEMERLLSQRQVLVSACASNPSAGDAAWEREDESGWARERRAESDRVEKARATLASFDRRHPEVAQEAKRRAEEEHQRQVRAADNT